MLLITGCPAVDDDFGMGGPTEPQFPQPGDADYPCGVGYDFDPVANVCSCPEGKVEISEYDCFELPTGFYYSPMSNCVMNWGIAFSVGNDTSSYSTSRDMYSTIADIYTARADHNRPDFFPTSAMRYLFKEISPTQDSVMFEVRTSWFIDSETFEGPGPAPVFLFKGISNRSDSIVGTIYTGEGNHNYTVTNQTDECPVVFTRTVQ